MKRFAINLIATFLAFAAGIVTASTWHSRRTTIMIDPVVANAFNRCPPNQAPPAAPARPSIMLSAPDAVYFSHGRMKLVPERVQMVSESLRYQIDVSFPQIVGDENPLVRKINQQVRELATAKYQWPLNPSAADLERIDENNPGAFNTVNFTYEVGLATESFVSIHLVGYNYSAEAANSVQESSTVNYDLTTGKRLNLSDMFTRGSNYLEFISRYCLDELSTGAKGNLLVKERLAPAAGNFEDWYISANGISFTFDGCKVLSCAAADQVVEIPFSDLKPVLNPGMPGKFKIVYP